MIALIESFDTSPFLNYVMWIEMYYVFKSILTLNKWFVIFLTECCNLSSFVTVLWVGKNFGVLD